MALIRGLARTALFVVGFWSIGWLTTILLIDIGPTAFGIWLAGAAAIWLLIDITDRISRGRTGLAYEWERDEWRAAAGADRGLGLAAACSHDYDRGVCLCCGDDEPRKDL